MPGNLHSYHRQELGHSQRVQCRTLPQIAAQLPGNAALWLVAKHDSRAEAAFYARKGPSMINSLTQWMRRHWIFIALIITRHSLRHRVDFGPSQYSFNTKSVWIFSNANGQLLQINLDAMVHWMNSPIPRQLGILEIVMGPRFAQLKPKRFLCVHTAITQSQTRPLR